ncbi:MAG TPA: S41 family peptidase [Allosphingosinicella sp.]
MAGLAAASAFPAAAQPSERPSTSAPAAAQAGAERLADLIRLWNFVRLFHVDERAMTSEWERALEEAAGPALAAPDDAALAQVARRMMARIEPSPSSPDPAPGPPAGAADVPPLRLDGGTAIISCVATARAIMRNERMGPPTPEQLTAIRERGLIFDCRGFETGDEGNQQAVAFHRWFSFSAPGFVDRPVGRGAMRQRFHDGFPPDTGLSSGGYQRGVSDSRISRLDPSPGPGAPAKRIVFIADASTPDPWTLAGGLHAADIGGLVAQGRIAEPDLQPFSTRHLNLTVRTAEYVAPDGRAGFRADACVAAAAAEAAMSAARAMLAGRPGPRCAVPRAAAASIAAGPAPAEARVSAPETPASGGAPLPLSLGQRIVALAKLWGTIEYFFPYRSLTDRPWSATLDEFVPVFAAASTREAYEDAVVRLAQRTHDSHSFVSGLRAHRSRPLWAPRIYVRPVEGRFAVAGLLDPALADRLKIGDEIAAVDGRPVAELAAEMRPFIASSTAQSLAQGTAMFLLSGAENSEARLTIRRGGEASAEVTIPRSIRVLAAAQLPSQEPSFRRIEAGIGYINLERLTRADADRAMDALMDTQALIFDLRGYPQGTAWALAPRLALDGREGADAAQFRRPSYRGPSEPQQSWTSFTQPIPTGTRPRYRGRIFVLIDDRAISQSEHTALFFKAAANPVFVGTPTAGANGDVTRLSLPGGLSLSFTGHDVRHADGTRLQRVGIQPDVVVAPTLAGMRAGRDEVLEAALEQARRPTR